MLKCIFLFIVIVIGSHYAQTNDRLKAIELNNRAVELYNKFYDDTEIIKYILQLYDEAIEADSSYEMAYTNKSNLLIEIGKCEESLYTLDKLVAIRRDLVGYWSMGGYILEAMGRKEEAEKRYCDDISMLDSIIQTEQDSLLVYHKTQRAFLLMLVEGKQKGKKEYEKLKINYPGNQYISHQEILFETFDREKFISNYCKLFERFKGYQHYEKYYSNPLSTSSNLKLTSSHSLTFLSSDDFSFWCLSFNSLI